MRQLALDLPFDSVDAEVRHLGPEVCQRPLDDLRPDEALFSTVLDGCKHVSIPWHRKQSASVTVQPLEVFSFWTVPGPGSEWASFGLARYPAEIEATYSPRSDDRFIRTVKKGGMTRWEFDWKRWERWLKQNGHSRWEFPEDDKFQQKRKVKTGLGSGWHYSSFCKTQYASSPSQGGSIPNFVRCHLCVIHLLDRIAELPTMKVEINDEGNYGRSYYTDDPWAEKRVYTWHEGKYDVKALVQEVGEWNEMIAAMAGAMNDALKAHGGGLGIDAPILHSWLVELLQDRPQLHKSCKRVGPQGFLDCGESDMQEGRHIDCHVPQQVPSVEHHRCPPRLYTGPLPGHGSDVLLCVAGAVSTRLQPAEPGRRRMGGRLRPPRPFAARLRRPQVEGIGSRRLSLPWMCSRGHVQDFTCGPYRTCQPLCQPRNGEQLG
jgi:hypothetical protein